MKILNILYLVIIILNYNNKSIKNEIKYKTFSDSSINNSIDSNSGINLILRRFDSICDSNYLENNLNFISLIFDVDKIKFTEHINEFQSFDGVFLLNNNINLKSKIFKYKFKDSLYTIDCFKLLNSKKINRLKSKEPQFLFLSQNNEFLTIYILEKKEYEYYKIISTAFEKIW